MQRIMNKDISDNIQKILNERVSREGKNISVINLLNDRLRSFMISINENLEDSEFEYSKDRKKKNCNFRSCWINNTRIFFDKEFKEKTIRKWNN